MKYLVNFSMSGWCSRCSKNIEECTCPNTKYWA